MLPGRRFVPLPQGLDENDFLLDRGTNEGVCDGLALSFQIWFIPTLNVPCWLCDGVEMYVCMFVQISTNDDVMMDTRERPYLFVSRQEEEGEMPSRCSSSNHGFVTIDGR